MDQDRESGHTRGTMIAIAASLWSPEETHPGVDEYRRGMIDLIAFVTHESDGDIDAEREDIEFEILWEAQP